MDLGLQVIITFLMKKLKGKQGINLLTTSLKILEENKGKNNDHTIRCLRFLGDVYVSK